MFGLVGPDGAGKTTIMRMLAGGDARPTKARSLIEGVDAVADPEQVRAHVSYMPQRFGLYEDLTVDENIASSPTSSASAARTATSAPSACSPPPA